MYIEYMDIKFIFPIRYSSKENSSFESHLPFLRPQSAALSNGEQVLSLQAVPYANILNFHGKFQDFIHKY